MISYMFKEGPVTIKAAAKADPQKIGEALARIAAAADGRLTPTAVVEAARAPRHVLHKHFEWDDEVAADLYRLNQAREIIRIIRIEDEESTGGSEPAFLSIADKGGVSYRTVQEVRSSADLQMIVLRQAERDLEAFDRRYRELTDVCALVRQARGKVREKREKIESRAAA